MTWHRDAIQFHKLIWRIAGVCLGTKRSRRGGSLPRIILLARTRLASEMRRLKHPQLPTPPDFPQRSPLPFASLRLCASCPAYFLVQSRKVNWVRVNRLNWVRVNRLTISSHFVNPRSLTPFMKFWLVPTGWVAYLSSVSSDEVFINSKVGIESADWDWQNL